MNYKFATIRELDDILWAIEGNEAFRVVHKGDYIVVNYSVIGNAFAALPQNPTREDYLKFAIHRECRGLKFDSDGVLIARPFHKFFNWNEKFETLDENVPWHLPVRVENKLDGSMIHPAMVNGEMRLMTKMGITDTSIMAEKYLAPHSNVIRFMKEQIRLGFTPIFEYTGPFNRIVLDYPTENMTLLAVRENETGSYVLRGDLEDNAKFYGIPVVSEEIIFDLNSYQESGKDVEGVVVCWDNGHRMKIKTKWYSELHHAKEALLSDKKVLAMCFSENFDDVSSTLTALDREALVNYQQTAVMAAREIIREVDQSFSLFKLLAPEVSPKAFALEMKDKVPSIFQPECFKAIREDRTPDFEKSLKDAVDKTSQYDTVMNILRLQPWTSFHRLSYAQNMGEEG